MDSPSAFLDRAIEENQLTIRAIDVKVTALLAAVLAPLAAISRVFAHLESFYNLSPHWSMFAITVAFLMIWLATLACMVLAIAPLDNPALHIPHAKVYKGSFYAGGMFRLTWVDALVNMRDVIATKNPTDYVRDLPSSEQEILEALAFEQMKLAYIRDMKVNRLKWGLRFAGVWLALGIGIFLASHYLSPTVGK